MRLVIVIVINLLFIGCVGQIWTGASLVYNRHTLYKKFSDYKLTYQAKQILNDHNLLKCDSCEFEITAFNGDILILGHLPSQSLILKAKNYLHALQDYRRLILQMHIYSKPSNKLLDSWITAKIRSYVLADADLNPSLFKIVTFDQVVYVMGDVERLQGAKVINMARSIVEVVRVVTLLKYISYR